MRILIKNGLIRIIPISICVYRRMDEKLYGGTVYGWNKNNKN